MSISGSRSRGRRVIDEQTERIGVRIRALRHAQRMTLVQLATLAGLSHSFLSQLERGHFRPSMVSLERIARALGSTQGELLAAAEGPEPGPEPSAATVVRAEEGARSPYAGGEARLLMHSNRLFHPLEFQGHNTDPGEYYVHEDDEFIYVMAGRIRVDLAEHGLFLLGAGDSIYYLGGTRHRWASPDGADYRLFLVKQKAVADERGLAAADVFGEGRAVPEEHRRD